MGDSDSFEQASAHLGSYMLQGWILTDQQCPQSDCPTPLLRSRDGAQKICVVHDLSAPSTPQNKPTTKGNEESAVCNTKHTILDNDIHSTSDIEEDDDAEEFIQRVKAGSNDGSSVASVRREQSNRASQLIGQKLLQQWTLVNDVCPNDTCFAVPLVRDQQQRLYCVICEQTYMTENAYLQSMRKRESEGDAPRKENVQSTTNSSKTITHDINLRDMDIDLDDPQLLADQLQLLQRKAETKAPNTLIAATHTTSVATASEESPSGSLLNELKRKVDRLSEDAIAAQDPTALVKLFEAIKAGSEAIEAYRRIC